MASRVTKLECGLCERRGHFKLIRLGSGFGCPRCVRDAELSLELKDNCDKHVGGFRLTVQPLTPTPTSWPTAT